MSQPRPNPKGMVAWWRGLVECGTYVHSPELLDKLSAANPCGPNDPQTGNSGPYTLLGFYWYMLYGLNCVVHLVLLDVAGIAPDMTDIARSCAVTFEASC